MNNLYILSGKGCLLAFQRVLMILASQSVDIFQGQTKKIQFT